VGAGQYDCLKDMKKHKECAVLLISLHNQSGRAVDALTNALFRKLNKDSRAKQSAFTVSINSVAQDRHQSGSWFVDIETTQTIKRCTIQEFIIPMSQGLSIRAFIFWTFRAVLRSGKYLVFKAKDMWKDASSIGRKLLIIPKMIVLTIVTGLETLFFYYFIPIMSSTVIRALRKIGVVTYISFFLLIVFAALLVNWEGRLIPLVSWISQITHTIVDSLEDDQLTFAVLFPVICSTVFAAALTVIIIFGRGVQWIFRRLDNYLEQGNPRLINEYSYLLDPLYATKLRGDFERQMISLNDKPDIERIFVVCEKAGILLAYEVLSRICLEKISKPVYLLTRDFSVAGLFAAPDRSLWLLVDSSDWNRFSKATPSKLFWYHFARSWPCSEYKMRMTTLPHHIIPSVKTHFRRRYWFKRRNTALIERLSTLIRD